MRKERKSKNTENNKIPENEDVTVERISKTSSTNEEEFHACEQMNIEEQLSNNDDLNFNFADPGSWPKMFTDTQRCFITKMIVGLHFECDLENSYRDGRHLTKDWFFKLLPNGHTVRRSWLAYSKSKRSLYCIPCRLFSHLTLEKQISSLAKIEGFTQWKKLSSRIPEHENSLNHKMHFCSWKTLQTSLEKGGVDKELQDQIQQEENHWRAVLHAIVDVIIHLAKQCSPFRGSVENLDFGNPKCGKFLNTIELVSHYHMPLREHIERHKKGQVSYFSHNIQNEFLHIIASKIREIILKNIKEAKYFSMMFDCTPDIDHVEQMSQGMRYVKLDGDSFEINENFLDFFTVSDKSGEGLSQSILQKLDKDEIDIKNCVGQCYDNAANMAGKYKGVQSIILKENRLAYFIPCSAHSLNLVGVNAASSSINAENYFGTLHCLYSFFAASTNRWEFLQNHVPVTLKTPSKTRWSAKLQAVKAVFMHLDKIIEVLKSLKCSSNPEIKTEAASILKNIMKFEFIVMCCFWYNILSRIDRVNKLLQKEDITIDESVKHINGLSDLLASIRETSVTSAISDAKDMCEKLGVTPNFKDTRTRKKKRFFDEECEDESCQLSEEEKHKISLLEIMDRIKFELESRFQALKTLSSKFSFLHGSKFSSLSTEELKQQASNFADTYGQEIDKRELLLEIESFKYHALKLDDRVKDATPSGLLKFILKSGLHDAYPNMSTALRIYLTMPVTVASNERFFSKLKLVKSYLRNKTEQQRLSDLSIISIEYELASKLCYEDIINTFAAKKARKVKL